MTLPPRTLRFADFVPTVRAVAGAFVLLLALVVLAGGTHAASPGPNVSITDSAYSPAALTIAQHGAVFWKNDGAAKHTVTADDGSFDSGPLNPGDAFGNVFDVAGTFAYHDTTSGSSLKGTIRVTAVAATPVPTGPTPPAGTLPPGFHTPIPVPTVLPTPTPGALPSASGGGSGGSVNRGVLLGALLLLVAIVAVVAAMSRRRRSG